MRGGSPLTVPRISEAHSCRSSACWDDVVTAATCAASVRGNWRGGSRPFVDSFNLLVIPPWVGQRGLLSDGSSQVINRDSFHPPTRKSNYEREKMANGNICVRDGVRDHHCQRALGSIGGTDLERTRRLLKNSWLHVVEGFFFGGWGTSGSLANLFEPLFLSYLTHSIGAALPFQTDSTCVESPAHN